MGENDVLDQHVVELDHDPEIHDQFLGVAKHAAPERMLREIAEEPLDHIEPRGTCWTEVNMEVRVALQPTFDFGMRVGRVVIDDQMQVFVGREASSRRRRNSSHS